MGPKMREVKLAQKLLELAELRDWSVRKVADNAGVASSTLYNAMNRPKAVLNVQDAIAISKVMDVPVDWLFDDEKGWTELKPHRPFWLPPGIDPAGTIAGLKHLRAGLGQVEKDAHGISSGQPSRKEGRRADTGKKGAGRRGRRKSGGSAA